MTLKGSKSILQSITFWGIVVAVLAPIAQANGIFLDMLGPYAPLIGIAGGAVGVYGRVNATKKVRLI